MDSVGNSVRLSPIEAFRRASSVHRLAFPNPLDLFAAHRFLLTLLYWKAEGLGDVPALREELLTGKMPGNIVEALAAESGRFGLFDPKQPFMQDPFCIGEKKSPPSYLFAEMASGTNVAHFHHGDDSSSALCLRCATRGLMRLVPWTQSGGSGLQPSIHGAPPIMAIALGADLCVTLGLNLVPMKDPYGYPQWSGQFKPCNHGKVVPVLEALTWNPRRVNLLGPETGRRCSLCGQESAVTVGPIIFEKNEACKDDSAAGKEYKTSWCDPAAFHRAKDGKTVKSSNESEVVVSSDLKRLFQQKRGNKEEPAPFCQIVSANSEHEGWLLVVPCTNPANNKSFDHRAVFHSGKMTGLCPFTQDRESDIPWRAGDIRVLGLPPLGPASPGAKAFVNAARRLEEADWAIISGCAGRPLSHDVGAFDIFSSIYWRVRSRVFPAPSRDAAWMTLKLMACAGASRIQIGASFHPWSNLEVRQPRQRSRAGTTLAYPRRAPTGPRLERELSRIIQRIANRAVDWAGLCQFLHCHLSGPF